jgi:hypothetical protein
LAITKKPKTYRSKVNWYVSNWEDSTIHVFRTKAQAKAFAYAEYPESIASERAVLWIDWLDAQAKDLKLALSQTAKITDHRTEAQAEAPGASGIVFTELWQCEGWNKTPEQAAKDFAESYWDKPRKLCGKTGSMIHPGGLFSLVGGLATYRVKLQYLTGMPGVSGYVISRIERTGEA